MGKGMIDNIKDIQRIADRDCYCTEEEQLEADCDECDIHKASSILNQIGEIIGYYLSKP